MLIVARLFHVFTDSVIVNDRIALPEGATRDNVVLTVLPSDSLHILFSPEDSRPVSRNVRLPRDAVLSQTKAMFEGEAEEVEEAEWKKAGGPASQNGVCMLEVVVGKAIPPEPQHIEIQ